MSRILRRPMFRGGGPVSSYGNGIATGLAKGGEVQPLLVGQHPESAKGSDGREKHGYPLLASAAAGLGNLGMRYGVRPAIKYGTKGINSLRNMFTNRSFRKGGDRFSKDVAGDYTPVTGISKSTLSDFTMPAMPGFIKTGLNYVKQNPKKLGLGLGAYALSDFDLLPSGRNIARLLPNVIERKIFDDMKEEKEVVTENATGDNVFSLDEYLTKQLGETTTKDKRSAKEKIAENTKLFKEALGSGKSARIEDASEMALSFASKALSEGATVKSAFADFLGDESKRPSRSRKIDDIAAQAAIQSYLAGETSYQKFKDQLDMKKDLLKAQIDMTEAATSLDDRLNLAVKSTGGRKTDKGVLQSALDEHFTSLGLGKIKYQGEMPEEITEEFKFIEGGIYSDPQEDGSVKIFIVQNGTPREFKTIFNK